MKRIACFILTFTIIACQPQAPASPTPEILSQSPAPSDTPTAPPPTTTPTPDPKAMAFLTRPEGAVLRVMSYNVHWDSIFPDDDPLNHGWRSGDRGEAFRRILQAVRPDVVCLQEINSLRPPEHTAAIFDQAIPQSNGAPWNAVSAGDNVILSPYPLGRDGYQLPGLGHAAALIDLPDETFGASDLYMVCSHFKSGGARSDINIRQRQADTIIAHIRDALTPGDRLDLPHGTPLILLGDYNIYDTDPAFHLTTLLTGDIVSEDLYGPDISPDWDATDLADALPYHNGGDDITYTWRNDSEPFIPGALDRILYSDSVLLIVNAFVLNTMLLPPAELAALGLEAEDVMVQPAFGNYDHLPIVVDFVLVDS